MNISTLAKILGVSISDLREVGSKNGLYGFFGRNTRIPYKSALEITKILKPEKLEKLKNDDKIYLPASMTVAEFGETIGRPVSQVIKTLMMNGVIATMNEKIDYDTAYLIAEELKVEVFPEDDSFDTVSNSNSQTDTNFINIVEYTDKKEEVKQFTLRPPVVTVMGHVDHGKTTLLDTIRKTNVVATEAGAITQHISSYQIEYKTEKDKLSNLHLPKGKSGGYKLTFIDTPGHEAFTAMRARGSQMADFIILMVSSVEGPKPQTVEVIERAKLGKIPIVVALNKVDLPDADPERVKTELTNYGLVPEEWGGQTPFIPISAKKGENIDLLLETILEHAELLELKGEVDCAGQAIVLESNLDVKLGVITTCIAVKDKIKVGDIIRCDEVVSKIKKLETTDGKVVQEVELGMPFVLLGLGQSVDVGNPVIVYETVKSAQSDANKISLQKSTQRKSSNISNNTASPDNTINLVIKADVSGSLEALKESILKIPQEQTKVIIKSEGIGPVNEGDLDFAQTSNSTIMAFHVDIPSKVEQNLKTKKVNYIQSDIIYQLIEWVEEQILLNVKVETKEVEMGKAKVLAVFKADKPSIQVFGGEVIEGKILAGKQLRLKRKVGEEMEDLGKFDIVELQRNKDKVEEIFINQQFGVSVKGNKNKLKIGDEIVCIDEVIVKKSNE
jgi:translation initiation factor IF-2